MKLRSLAIVFSLYIVQVIIPKQLFDILDVTSLQEHRFEMRKYLYAAFYFRIRIMQLITNLTQIIRHEKLFIRILMINLKRTNRLVFTIIAIYIFCVTEKLRTVQYLFCSYAKSQILKYDSCYPFHFESCDTSKKYSERFNFFLLCRVFLRYIIEKYIHPRNRESSTCFG